MKLTIYDTQRVAGPVADEDDPSLCGDCVHLDSEWSHCGLTGASLRRSDSDLRYRYERAKECIAATGWHIDSVSQSHASSCGWRPRIDLRAGRRLCSVELHVRHDHLVKLAVDQTAGTFHGRMTHADLDHVASFAARIVELLLLGLDPEDAWRRVVGKDGAA